MKLNAVINVNTPGTSRDRPKKCFGESSYRSRRRKSKVIAEKQSSEAIMLAAELDLRRSDKMDAANIVKELSLTSPRRATKFKKARKLFESKPKQMSPEQALAFYVSANLTYNQYKIMYNNAKELGSNIYPPYYILQHAKKECYPSVDNISVTEVMAEIQLQSVLDHTVRRILDVQEEVVANIQEPNVLRLTLISKWGCDGSAGHSINNFLKRKDFPMNIYLLFLSYQYSCTLKALTEN